jgi:F-type H+-transporting ATPase subunit b
MYTLLAAEQSPLLQANPGLMIWTLITFFLAMIIMYKLAFGPIQEGIDKRRQAIIDSVETAERTKAEAAELLVEYKQQLADAKNEAQAIVDRARKAGDELTAKIKAEGDNQRREAVEATQQQVRAEIDKAVAELKTTVAEMTVTAAEKVLKGSIDQAQHARLIEQAVEDLDFDKLQKVGAGS